MIRVAAMYLIIQVFEGKIVVFFQNLQQTFVG